MQNLVIVESPTKARTLAKFLGKKYQIDASMGHIRDLPKSELGVDVEQNFEPKYIIPRDKKKKANEIIKLAKQADTIWLASDPDREGEAIAWHISELIHNLEGRRQKAEGKNGTKLHPELARPEQDQRVSGSQQIKRVVFHEITESAIKDAFNHPREIDLKLVDAQQARRVLDRLVGYKLSPLLWKKVKRGISAGRVQSVALRLVVEREREIQAFKPEEYWSIDVILSIAKDLPSSEDSSPSTNTQDQNDKAQFTASLIEINGQKAEIKNEQESKTAVEFLESANYRVSKVIKKEVKRNPYPPFTTSTLQQASANKLGYTAKKTMNLAQNLYERGLITYMRTDSVNLSTESINAVRDFINQTFGKDYLPANPKVYKSKSKNAQEAHEAIRPTDVKRLTSEVAQHPDLNRDHARLYDLIWKRFVACQVNEAMMDQTSIDVSANAMVGPASEVSRRPSSVAVLPAGVHQDLSSLSPAKQSYLLRAAGSVIKFDGWLKVYGQIQAEEEQEQLDSDKDSEILPELVEGEPLNKLQVLPEQHFTEPPPRFNEASLIKKLEELGIGRPSTYAPILSTIQERYYVEKNERRFTATALGMAVIDFLMKYFSDIIDYDFTAQMEDELDNIATGEKQWKPLISNFYQPFEKKIEQTEETAEKIQMEVETTDRVCPECGKFLIVRTGKFGKFLACSGFPECKHTESIEERVDAKCPEDGGEILVRKTRHGKTFYGCKNWPTCKYASWTKPKSDSASEAKESS